MAKSESKGAIDRGMLLLNLLDPIQRTRKQIHGMLIERGYDISEKSVERDLNRLVDLFPRHVSYIKKFPPFGYRLREPAKMSFMKPEEAISVLTAYEYLDPLIPKLAQGLDLYIKEAENVLEHNFSSNYRNWKQKISIKNEGFQLKPKLIKRTVLQNIHAAILLGKSISCTYHARATLQDKKFKEIFPIGLVHCGRLIYLIGSHDKAAKKRFGWPLHRFKSINVNDEINPLKDESVNKHIKDGMLGFLLSNIEKKVVLKFQKNAGYIFKETKTSSKMKFKETKESIIIEDKLPDTSELENWILGFGEKVEVLEPLELREKIKMRLKESIEKYK